MNKAKKTTKKYKDTPNPAIEKFEKMFKEIDIQPNTESTPKKERKYPGWIFSGSSSNLKKVYISMANYKDIEDELSRAGDVHDVVRRMYIGDLQKHTKRNTIAYYSGWLQKKVPDLSLGIDDYDKNGFMTTIHGLDTRKGLDLILHTLGGEVAAAESIIDYLLQKFQDIRVVVPQLAMSAGTMIACSADKILMGRHSSLGPVDPIYDGFSAHAVLEEFDKAYEEIKADPIKVAIWKPILEKYEPTLLGECKKSIIWAEKIISENLREEDV